MGSSPAGGDGVPVAKWIRRWFPEPKIAGSSPARDDGARSVMVIIGASQALDPGSIPGERRSGH